MVIMGGRSDRSNSRARCVELNEFISCIICEGYLIDATTVIECLHSFCKTCIVKHLKTDNTCPRCKTLVHKTKPLRGLRSDPTLQDIVYKVVPGLYKDEMVRRRSLYQENPDAAKNITSGEEKGEYSGERTIYSSEDIIPISLQYVPREINYSYQPMKDKAGLETKDVANTLGEHGQVRFFRCVSAVTIRILKKLLRNKFDLKYHHDVQLFYKHDPLFDEYSILDLAYIYSWKRNVPLSLYYKISDLRSVTIKSTTKVPTKRKSAQATALTSTTTTTALQAATNNKPLTKQHVVVNPSPLPVLSVPCPAPKVPVTMPITISTSPPPASLPPHTSIRKIPRPDSSKLAGLEAVRREAASILKEVEESQRKQQQQQQQSSIPRPVAVTQAAALPHENPLAQNLNKITQLVANIRPNSNGSVADPSAVKKRKIVREPRGRKPKGAMAGIGSNCNPNSRGRPATVRDLITAQPSSAFRKIAPSPDPFMLHNSAAFLARQSLQLQQHAQQPSASHLLSLASNPDVATASVHANILSNSELTITCTNGAAPGVLPASTQVTNPVVPQPAHVVSKTSLSSSSSSSSLNPSLVTESTTKVIRSDSSSSSTRIERQSPPVTTDAVNNTNNNVSSTIDSSHLLPAKPGSLLAMAQSIIPASTTVSLAPASSSANASSPQPQLCKPVNGHSDGTKIGSVIEKLAAKATCIEPTSTMPPVTAIAIHVTDGDKEKEKEPDVSKKESKSGDELSGKSVSRTISHLPLAQLTSYPAAGVQPLRKPIRMPSSRTTSSDDLKKSIRDPVIGKSKDDSDILFVGIDAGSKLDSQESHLIPALNLSSSNFKVPYPPDSSPKGGLEIFSDENGQKNARSPLSPPISPQASQRMTSSPKLI